MQKQYNLKSVNMISPKYDLTLSILNKTIKEMTEFPEGTTSISGIFNNCQELERVILPEGVTKISSFTNCKKLYYIELPKTLNSLGMWVFEYCNSLKNINYRGTMEEWSVLIKNSSSQWDYLSSVEKIICSDGTINLKEE